MLRIEGRSWGTGYGSMRSGRSTRCLVGRGCVACMEIESAIALGSLVALALKELVSEGSTCWRTDAVQTVDHVGQFERCVAVEYFATHGPEN